MSGFQTQSSTDSDLQIELHPGNPLNGSATCTTERRKNLAADPVVELNKS